MGCRVVGFQPLVGPRPQLERIVAIWQRGRHRVVPFEASCARAYWRQRQRGPVRAFDRERIARAFAHTCRDDAAWRLAFRGQPGLFEIDATERDWTFPALVEALTGPLEQARIRWERP